MTIKASLYFHIPFCKRKCDYCHFYVIPDKEEHKHRFLHAMRQEWAYRLPLLKNVTIETVYFGGGTPSLLGPTGIESLLNLVRSDCSFTSSEPEITLEANPETITYDRVIDYKSTGINRFSIGVQTLDDHLLQKIGRQHKSDTALKSIETTHQGGISNISIDLMYDLPEQTLTSWSNTLQKIRHLPITHLSLYNLTIEPQTVFYKFRTQLSQLQPTENDSLLMYQTAVAELAQMGLQQYEISAFAAKNRESSHNKGYWLGRPFLGYGPSAFSYWDRSRFRNIAHLNKWCAALDGNLDPCDFREKLSHEDSRNEMLAVNLRLLEGVNLEIFRQEYGKLSAEKEKTLSKLIETQMLKQEGSQLSLSQQGILFYDTIASEIIS